MNDELLFGNWHGNHFSVAMNHERKTNKVNGSRREPSNWLSSLARDVPVPDCLAGLPCRIALPGCLLPCRVALPGCLAGLNTLSILGSVHSAS